jgi:hypothetical protein
MAYDDGFRRLFEWRGDCARNAPGTTAFNSSATSKRPGGAALTAKKSMSSAYAALLLPGDNVLAIQGMNANAADTEFLIQPELFAGQSLSGRWFVPPLPGSANGAATLDSRRTRPSARTAVFTTTPQTVTISV